MKSLLVAPLIFLSFLQSGYLGAKEPKTIVLKCRNTLEMNVLDKKITSIYDSYYFINLKNNIALELFSNPIGTPLKQNHSYFSNQTKISKKYITLELRKADWFKKTEINRLTGERRISMPGEQGDKLQAWDFNPCQEIDFPDRYFDF